MPSRTDVVVIGAGPAGLACSACLGRAGVRHELLERASRVAPAWHAHYDRLHLHTSRGFSGLPFRPMPRTYPRYPTREQVVAYLEDYCRSLGLEPRLGVEVRRVEQESPGWVVTTDAGTVSCRHLVVATGVNGAPRRVRWDGLDTFPGPVVHSSEYRNGQDFSGKRVLVVGMGNSGGELALDLLEHGATPSICVRSAVNVIPRDVLGIPILAIAIPLSRLPPRLADLLVWPILKGYYPSYRRLGLRKAGVGPFRQIADRSRIPLLDIGTTRALRRGRLTALPDVRSVQGSDVTFVDGVARAFDAIVLATGFEPRLPDGVTRPEAEDARPTNLHFCGFFVAPTGMLREIGIEAHRITASILRAR